MEANSPHAAHHPANLQPSRVTPTAVVLRTTDYADFGMLAEASQVDAEAVQWSAGYLPQEVAEKLQAQMACSPARLAGLQLHFRIRPCRSAGVRSGAGSCCAADACTGSIPAVGQGANAGA